MDKRKNNSGTIGNKGGRKSKAEEQKVNTLFSTALQRMYNTDEPDEAKIKFIQELADSQRGQIFIAEHLFGKAPQVLDVETNDKGSVGIGNWIKKNKE